VTYAGSTASFNPTADLAVSTLFTATITTAVTDTSSNPLAANHVWTFTTASGAALGPATVDLLTAGNYAVLSKAGIENTSSATVTGDIGVSPIDSTALTGFSETLDGSGTFSTSILVTGSLFAANYGEPTPTELAQAVLDMEAAYADAAGRITPDFTELDGGSLTDTTIDLAPGLYSWTTPVSITTSITLNGGANDVWIFQLSDTFTMASSAEIFLVGGAQAKNVFWQVAGGITIGTGAVFNGIGLSMTSIVINTGAFYNGRVYAQTAVTIDAATVTEQ
jgi:hypothetical protein